MATKYTFFYSDTTKPEFSVYPYTTNGPTSPSDPIFIDHAVAATTTLKLYGKGMQDYGQGIEQDLIYMLENFAAGTEPGSAIEGQLWYNNIGTGSPILGPELFIRNSATAWDAVILATGTSAMTGELILDGNPSSALGAVPRQYVDAHTVLDTIHLTTTQNTFLDSLDLPTLTADEVNTLKGIVTGSPIGSITIQNQLDGKISRTGDTMDVSANLTINGGNLIVAPLGSPASPVTVGGGTITGLPLTPTDPDEAASKAYVESFVLTGAGGDGVLSQVDWIAAAGGSPLPNITETSLQFTITHPGSPNIGILTIDGVSRVGHAHTATEITFDNTGSPILDIAGASVQAVIENIDLIKANRASPTFTGTVTSSGGANFGGQVAAAEPVASNDLATKNYVDNVAAVGSGGTSTEPTELSVIRNLETLVADLTTPAPYEILAHVVNDNKLSITINGLKQYAHTHGVQRVRYDTSVGLISSTTYTGLDATVTYDFAVSINGGGAVTVTIPAGASVVTHGSLIATINSIMSSGSPHLAHVLFELEDDDLEKFTTDSAGSTSSIAITDPGVGSPDGTYLFATDPSPTVIISANFISAPSMGSGSPIIPDEIIISGDVTALFPAGKTFTIRGSVDATYGNFDSVYSVYQSGPSFGGSPGVTTIPIGWVADYTLNVPLLGAYIPGGSPSPTPPAPSPYGDVHFTPMGGFAQLEAAIAGTDGDYAETDISGNIVPVGEFSSYVTFNYTIPSGNQIENILLV